MKKMKESKWNKIKKYIEKFDVVIFLTVTIILLGSLLAFYPGSLTSDSVDQINSFNDNNYYNAHPVLHSFLVGLITKCAGTVAGVGLLQIIVFALIWTYACKIVREKSNSNSLKIAQLILSVIICFIPINFVFSVTVWKDIPYSYAALALIIYIYIGIKKDYKFSYIDIFLLSLSAVFVLKMRHNGIAITLIVVPILLVLNLIKQKKIMKTVFSIAIFLTILTVSKIPEWVLNVNESNFSSNVFTSTKIYCMSALLNNEVMLEEEEYTFINSIIPIDEWTNTYNPYSGLPLFYSKNYNKEFLSENEEQFNQIFFKYAKQNLKILVKHFIEVNSITWSPAERGRMTTFSTNNSYISEMSGGVYDNDSKSERLTKTYSSLINNTMENKVLYILFYRPAVPMYLATIIVLFLAVKKKKIGYILVLFPMFLNIGTYLFTIGSQDLRYYYINFLTCYFALLLLVEYFLKENKIEKKPRIKVNKNYKTLTIIPAYNESENIQKVLDELKQDFPETDILVINDCSKDNTKQIVESNNINCITTAFNLNYAYAVQTGIKYAKKYDYDYCLMFDGDGQHIAKEAKKLLDKIKESNCDIVIGSRYLEKGNYNAPKLRKIGTSFFIWLIKLSCRTKISDPLSGFQVINKRVIDKYSRMGEYPEFPDANLIIEMLLDGYSIEEVSVKMRNREFGESMHGGIIKPIKYMIVMLYTIVILILNKLFGRRK